MEKKLYRSRRDRMISGVCGGIAEYFEVDPTLIRIIAVVLAASGGAGVLAYIVMTIVVPEEPLVPASEGVTPVPYVSDDSARDGAAPAASPPGATAVAPPPPPPRTTSAGGTTGPDRPRGRGGITFGLVLVFIGVALLAAQFLPGVDLWRLWPLIIVIVGIRVMFRGGRDR